MRGGLCLAAMVAASLLGFGCSPSPRRPPSTVTRVGAFDVATYCELAARSDLAVLNEHSAILCEGPSDGDESAPRCRMWIADASGRVRDAGIEGVLRALRTYDGRWVIVTQDERLILHDGRRQIRELASWAAEPTLDSAGRRLAYVAAPEGVDEVALGDPTRLVLFDLVSNDLSVLVDDAHASAPLFVPDGSALLYVSTEGPVASVVRLDLTTRERITLTNEGLVDHGQGFVPVYDRQVAWSGPNTLIFEVRLDPRESELWVMDVRTGDAHRVGQGRFPMTTPEGRVVMVDPGSSRCPEELNFEVTP